MAWFRLHEGTYGDPKWPIIARKSGTNVGTVVSIWIALLDHASQNEERGSLEGFDPETIDALYGYGDGTCQSVIEAMASKGMIVDGRLANWEKRQPVKEDATASERKQRYNERKRNAQERSGTPENAPDKIREEEIKNINTHPPYPPGGRECEPDLEFLQFRDAYSRTVRKEAERSGLREWIAARRRRELPDLNFLFADITERMELGCWNAGYEPGLASYISSHGWTAEKVPWRREQPMSYAERDEQDWERLKAEARKLDKLGEAS